MRDFIVRDDFPKTVLETLAKRVGYRCSNLACRKLTSGPHTDDTRSLGKKQTIIEQMNTLLTEANLPRIRAGYGDQH